MSLNRLSLVLRSACRRNAPIRLGQTIFSRARSNDGSKKHRTMQLLPGVRMRDNVRDKRRDKRRGVQITRPMEDIREHPAVLMAVEDVPDHFKNNVTRWSRKKVVARRLVSFGIPFEHVKPLLSTYSSALSDGSVANVLRYSEEERTRIAYDLSHPGTTDMLDVYLTKMLYEWAASSKGQATLSKSLPPNVRHKLLQLFEAADLSRPFAWYSQTRRQASRKVIMHVGPTNSGKTHNALRALAAAGTGAYAGPLRLLAHEIWERLNHGQIVPAGVEPEPDAKPDPETNMELGGESVDGKGPVVQKDGNPKYARVCNMVTGEEQRITDDNAPLVSCTVEMISTDRRYDVAVVDEIQMITDRERGGAWTAAVLGINAAELHLCGEESAVPLIEAMLRNTGDELVVNRYQRLSPLQVAKSSLNKDLKQVQKGDCIVTFSRKVIFRIKDEIERTTNLRCAVAYGRLPPEVRSEQAALFNRPNSGYDVLVASDAIGMGLNLKIKRVIFESTAKFDGHAIKPLSTSQIKQIGGRAGRYGLHGEDPAPGVVTALSELDMPTIRKAMSRPMQPLRFARVSNSAADTYRQVVHALPPRASSGTITDVYKYVSKLHPLYEFVDYVSMKSRMDFVDQMSDDLTISDRILLHLAPTPNADDIAMDACSRVISIYRTDMRVSLQEALVQSGFWDGMQDTFHIAEADCDHDAESLGQMLQTLESLHKVLVLYLWLSYRKMVSFPDQQEAFEVKERAEKAMEWCLKKLTAKRLEEMGVMGGYGVLGQRRPRRDPQLNLKPQLPASSQSPALSQ